MWAEIDVHVTLSLPFDRAFTTTTTTTTTTYYLKQNKTQNTKSNEKYSGDD